MHVNAGSAQRHLTPIGPWGGTTARRPSGGDPPRPVTPASELSWPRVVITPGRMARSPFDAPARPANAAQARPDAAESGEGMRARDRAPPPPSDRTGEAPARRVGPPLVLADETASPRPTAEALSAKTDPGPPSPAQAGYAQAAAVLAPGGTVALRSSGNALTRFLLSG